jgi:hypothetical protein
MEAAFKNPASYIRNTWAANGFSSLANRAKLSMDTPGVTSSWRDLATGSWE